MKEAILTIDGMTCDNCAQHVQKSLKSVIGSKKFMEESGIPAGSIESELIQLESEARTIMLVAF